MFIRSMDRSIVRIQTYFMVSGGEGGGGLSKRYIEVWGEALRNCCLRLKVWSYLPAGDICSAISMIF